MTLVAVDITNILKLLFSTIYNIYLFLNSIEFTAFGYNFTLLGIMIGLLFLIILIKFMRFGFETGLGDEIKSSRAENKLYSSERKRLDLYWFNKGGYKNDK